MIFWNIRLFIEVGYISLTAGRSGRPLPKKAAGRPFLEFLSDFRVPGSGIYKRCQFWEEGHELSTINIWEINPSLYFHTFEFFLIFFLFSSLVFFNFIFINKTTHIWEGNLWLNVRLYFLRVGWIHAGASSMELSYIL